MEKKSYIFGKTSGGENWQFSGSLDIIGHVLFINRDIKVCWICPVTPVSCKCSLAQGMTDGQVVSECTVWPGPAWGAVDWQRPVQIPYSTGPSLSRMAARSGLKHSRDPHLLFGALHIDERWKMDSVCFIERENEKGVQNKKTSHIDLTHTETLSKHNRETNTDQMYSLYMR